uniref:HTH iclR-type domain-containing protein n=1 Tax=Ditylenchus dipsaci TaxID=166011 RepID=A0A915DWI2_9BILA
MARRTVSNAARRFKKTGANKNRIGREERGLQDLKIIWFDIVIRAANAIAESPSTKLNSTRKLARRMRISHSSAHRILVKDLELFPYKLHSRQELGPLHVVKRLDCCRAMKESKRRAGNQLGAVWQNFVEKDDANGDIVVSYRECMKIAFESPEQLQVDRPSSEETELDIYLNEIAQEELRKRQQSAGIRSGAKSWVGDILKRGIAARSS